MRDSPASCKRPAPGGTGRGGGSDCGRFVRSVVGQSTKAGPRLVARARGGSDCRGGLIGLDGKADGILRELGQNASDEGFGVEFGNADAGALSGRGPNNADVSHDAASRMNAESAISAADSAPNRRIR